MKSLARAVLSSNGSKPGRQEAHVAGAVRRMREKKTAQRIDADSGTGMTSLLGCIGQRDRKQGATNFPSSAHNSIASLKVQSIHANSRITLCTEMTFNTLSAFCL